MANVVSLEKEFLHCCELLVDGRAGSSAQKDAHEYLLAFQQQLHCWEVCLQAISNVTAPESAYFISCQVLRTVIPLLPIENQIQIRNHIAQFIIQSVVSNTNPSATRMRNVRREPTERLACLALASAIVYITTDWQEWKQFLYGALGIRGEVGIRLMLQVITSIPSEMVAVCTSSQDSNALNEMVRAFNKDKKDILELVIETSRSTPENSQVALQCLEQWGQTSIPSIDAEFGFTIFDLNESNIFDILFDFVICTKSELSELAADIIVESFSNAYSPIPSQSQWYCTFGTNTSNRHQYIASIMICTAQRLVPKLELIQQAKYIVDNRDNLSEDDIEIAITVVKNMTRIAYCIAFSHSHCVFGPSWCQSIRESLNCGPDFDKVFLGFLIECTTIPDHRVIHETLEVWFSIYQLDKDWSSVFQLPMHSYKSFYGSLYPMFNNVITILIQHCQYPQWFIASNSLLSDQNEIEDIKGLRREIGDTLLSLFSNWPTIATSSSNSKSTDIENGTIYCLHTMMQLFHSTNEIRLKEALVFLLDCMVELFDFDEENNSNSILHTVQGMWQNVIEGLVQLPPHPLLQLGTTRLIHTSVMWMSFQMPDYYRMLQALVKGLKYKTQVSNVAARTILKMSKLVVKACTTATTTNGNSSTTANGRKGRQECVELLLQSYALPIVTELFSAKVTIYGDCVEAVLRFSTDLPQEEYTTVISRVFPPIVQHLTNTTTDVVLLQNAIYLLSRAIQGLRYSSMKDECMAQNWSSIMSILSNANANNNSYMIAVFEKCCDLFIILAQHCGHRGILQDILTISTNWYTMYDALSSKLLNCLSHFVSNRLIQDDSNLQLQYISTIESIVGYTKDRIYAGDNNPNQYIDSEQRIVFVSTQDGQSSFIKQNEFIKDNLTQCFQLVSEIIRLHPTIFSCHNETKSTFFVQVIQFAVIVLNSNHQHQELTDGLSQFFIECLTVNDQDCQMLVMNTMEPLAIPFIELLLQYCFETTTNAHKPRSILNLLYQAVHGTNTNAQLRNTLKAALVQVIPQHPQCVRVLQANEITMFQNSIQTIREKRRFQIFFTNIVLYLVQLRKNPFQSMP